MTVSWRESITHGIKSWLKLLFFGAFQFAGIVFAFFVAWFVLKLAIKAMDVLNETWFA